MDREIIHKAVSGNMIQSISGSRIIVVRGRNEWRQMKSEFVNMRHEMRAALFSKMDASLKEKQRVLDVMRKAVREIQGKCVRGAGCSCRQSTKAYP